MPFTGVDLISLVENAAEGIIVADSQGIIRLANPSACKMFEYEDSELAGAAIEVLIPMRMKEKHEKLRAGFMDQPVNRVMGQGRDLKARKKNGLEFPVEISLSTYLQGGERFVIAFVIDITSRKEIEANMILQQKQLEQVTSEMRSLNAELEAKVEERTLILKEALQRLEQSQAELSEALDKEKQLNEIKGRFVSMASHEFRTPLSTVLSSAALITKYVSADDQPKRDRHIEKIRESVKHLNTLLEDFLSLGKLEEGKISAKEENFNIKKLVSETLYEMSGQLKEGQQVNYVHHGNEEIWNDKLLFKNILINLLSNAMKFSDTGKTITIRSQVEPAYTEISVKDEGIGISEEDKDHLFSTFFRAKNAFNIQGTGLGLHIIKRYIDLLGGTIHLESELNRGTKVTFIVPTKTLTT